MWALCFTVLRHAVFDGFAQCSSSREVCFSLMWEEFWCRMGLQSAETSYFH